MRPPTRRPPPLLPTSHSPILIRTFPPPFCLQLTNTLSENCGKLVHQEIASKSFTEGLERIITDRVRPLPLPTLPPFARQLPIDSLPLSLADYER